MREIKFRAWLPDGGMDGKGCMASLNNEELDMVTEDDGILMQYTGLKDKNGVGIYEGDLLQIEDESGNYNCFEVFYHDNDCIGGQNIGFCINRMHCQGNSGGGRGYKFTPNSIRDNNLVVCGNIYEHPNLLEGDNQDD